MSNDSRHAPSGTNGVPVGGLDKAARSTGGPSDLAQPSSPTPRKSPLDNPIANRKWPVVVGTRYAIQGERGRGGTGRVLEAIDTLMGRRVALKESLKRSRAAEARFLREAYITGLLQHPGIVPIHEVGCWADGKPFYTMPTVQGNPLSDLINGAKTLQARLALLPNLIAVADAVAYAHGQRVIHRDLKPANVLVGEFGETVVIDWGMATDLSQVRRESNDLSTPYKVAALGLTVEGTVMGTPEYMPPEQARGEPVDERADVYALGAILYHLLAGNPPYSGRSSEEVIEKVTIAPPPPVKQRQQGVPQDLAAIVGKAMARNPAERYPTAKEFAEELRRFQTGHLVSAYSYSKTTLARRWIRRHRLPVTLVASFLLTLSVMAFASVRRIVTERNDAQVARRASDEARALAESRRNEMILVQARSSLERDPTATLAWLKVYAANNAPVDAAQDLVVEAASAGVSRHVFHRSFTKASGTSFSPDSTLLAAVGPDASVRVYEIATGRTIATLPHSGEIREVAFSPAGTLLMWSEWEGSVIFLWDFRSGQTRQLAGHSGMITRTQFSPDSRFIVSSDDAGTVRLWNVSSGETRILYRTNKSIQFLFFGDNGRFVVSGSKDGEIHVWNLLENSGRRIKASEQVTGISLSANGQLLAYITVGGRIEIQHVPSLVRAYSFHCEPGRWFLVFSPDATRIAAAGQTGLIRVFSLLSGTAQALVGDGRRVHTVRFSPREDILASAGQDGAVRLWDLKSGDHRLLQGHRNAVFWLNFSPDGRFLATSSNDGTVRVWEISSVREPATVLAGHTDQVEYLTFSPDSQSLASNGADGVRVWDVESGRAKRVFGEDRNALRVRFDPSGTTLASAGFWRTVVLRNLSTDERRELSGNEGFMIWDVHFSHSGSLIASAGSDGTVRVWNTQKGEGSILGKHDAAVRAIAFSPDDHLLASAGADNVVKIWNLSDLSVQVLRGHRDLVYALAFRPDGGLLASASFDGDVRLWELNGNCRVLVGHTGRIRVIAFSPDGSLLVSGSEDGSARIWDVSAGTARFVLPHGHTVFDVAFSPRGDLMGAASFDKEVRLWDTRTFRLRSVVRHADRVLRVAFAPDGSRLASASSDKTIKLLNLRIAPDKEGFDVTVQARLERLTTAVITERGGISTAVKSEVVKGAASSPKAPSSTREL